MKDTGERLIPSESKDSVVYGEHMSRYLAVIDMIKGKVVLDVASGTGYGSQLLAKHAKKVTGIDYSAEAVAYAQENYPAKNLEYRVGDAQVLKSIPDSSIDIVVSMETIEHLPNPELFVKQVKRVLKPDGVFAVSTPNDEEYREGNEFHLHEFTLVELKKLMKKYFKQTDYYYQGNALAATLFNEADFKTEFRREVLVEKTISVDPERAIYFIAIATNSVKPPAITTNIAVSQHWNTKGFIEWSQEQEGLIKASDKKIISYESRLRILEDDLLEAEKEIMEIEQTRSWKLAQTQARYYRLLRYPRTTIKRIYKRLADKF